MASETNKRSVGSGVADTVEQAKQVGDEAASSMSHVADRIGAAVDSASDMAGSLYSGAAEHIRGAAPGSLADAAATGRRVVGEGQRRLHSGVRSQPVEALLLAGAIGYLVGWATIRG